MPGHGLVYDKLDLLEYRDAVTIVRDRVQDLIDEGQDARAGQGRQSRRSATAASTGRTSGPWTTDMFVEVDLQRARREEGDEEMSRALIVDLRVVAGLIALGLSSRIDAQRGGEPPQPPRAPRAAAPIDLTGYWVSIVTQDWRWRMVTPAKGDYQGIQMTPEASKGCRRLGSGERRSRRRAVQVLRRARADERPGAASHHLAGRQHAEGRDATPARRRVSCTSAQRTKTPRATRPRDLAGRLGGAVADAAPERAAAAQAGRSHRGRAAASPDRRIAASRHQEPPRRVPAEERRSLQRERRADRALGSLQAAERRGVAHDHDAGRRSSVSAQRELIAPVFKKEPNGSKWDPTPCSSTVVSS